MDLSYILNHLGENREDYLNAVVPPVFQTSNFCFPNVSTMRSKLENELENPFYTRGYNPGVAILRKKLAALEGAEDCLVFSSGSAAVAAAVMSVVQAGDEVVCVTKPYSWTNTLLSGYLKKFGVTVRFADGDKIIESVSEKTRLVYLESPNSLTFEVQDISLICAEMKRRGIKTIIDNSYNSPLNQSPITLGADLVVHSGTKYLNGHSDVVAGVVCGSREHIMKMFREEYMTIGSIISPHDAWLLIRGLRTLELRVNRSSESALKVAEFLENHPMVNNVYYPFLKSSPHYDLAKKQMKQGGGLVTVVLKTNSVSEVEKFCNSLKRFLLATSWGGFESLCFPMCALKGSSSFTSPLPPNMVRLYIGIEDVEVLIEDLDRALKN